jgi:hypothetical protein
MPTHSKPINPSLVSADNDSANGEHKSWRKSAEVAVRNAEAASTTAACRDRRGCVI